MKLCANLAKSAQNLMQVAENKNRARFDRRRPAAHQLQVRLMRMMLIIIVMMMIIMVMMVIIMVMMMMMQLMHDGCDDHVMSCDHL